MFERLRNYFSDDARASRIQTRQEWKERSKRAHAEEYAILHATNPSLFATTDARSNVSMTHVYERIKNRYSFDTKINLIRRDGAPAEVAARIERAAEIRVLRGADLWVGDEVRDVNGHTLGFVAEIKPVPNGQTLMTVPVRGPCGENWSARIWSLEHLVVRIERKPILNERIFIEHLDAFEFVRDVSPQMVEAMLRNGRLEVSEDDVQSALERALGETFHRVDHGGEENDLFTTQLKVAGKRVPTAFLLKGAGTKSKELQIANCGKNGDQIVRLFQSPAELFVVQYVGPISDNVLKDVRGKTRERVAQGESARYCVIDGTDTARLMFGRGLLDGSD
jgi:hypothetical protein